MTGDDERKAGWRTRRRRLALVLAALVAAGVAGPARATEGVWISNARGTGQGQVFMLDRRCYAYTAGHVVDAGAGISTLTAADGQQVQAVTVAARVDEEADLGLLRIKDTAERVRRFCQRTQVPTLLPTAALMQLATERPLVVWLDRVEAADGRLDRFDLAWSDPPAGAARFRLRGAEASAGRLPGPGDSGAPVWVAPDDRTARLRRYQADSTPAPRFGTGHRLLGVYVGGGTGPAGVVPAERLYDFVLQSLRPVDWARISVQPAGARITQALRGDFPDPHRARVLSLDATALDRLSFEIDLGDADRVVESVTLRGAGALREPGRHPVEAIVRVQSSSLPPGAQARWSAEQCVPRSDRPRATDGGWTSGCELRTRRGSRGLRVQVSGAASGLQQIELVLQRP